MTQYYLTFSYIFNYERFSRVSHNYIYEERAKGLDLDRQRPQYIIIYIHWVPDLPLSSCYRSKKLRRT